MISFNMLGTWGVNINALTHQFGSRHTSYPVARFAGLYLDALLGKEEVVGICCFISLFSFYYLLHFHAIISKVLCVSMHLKGRKRSILR